MTNDPSRDLADAEARLAKQLSRQAGCMSWLYGFELIYYILFVAIPVLLICVCCGWFYWESYVVR